MKYLGIDYGARRIGLATSDENGEFAFPKETIPNDLSSIDRITRIIRQDNIAGVVIGDTRADTGVENPITKEVETFGEALQHHAGVPVSFVREAWSSFEAARFAPKGKEHDDAAAAAIILQRFLDAHRESDV